MTFTLSAPPNTDIWRKPPSTNAFNAPTSHQPATGPLKQFQSARITFSFTPSEQYDQAGLLLHLTQRGHQCRDSQAISPDSALHQSCKWLKTGVEFYQGQALVSTVGCDNHADWSVVPLAATDPSQQCDQVKEVTVEAKRERDENGKGLWIYQIVGEKKVPLREVAWFFALEDDVAWEIGVAAYACRPKEADGELKTEFSGFDVEFGS